MKTTRRETILCELPGEDSSQRLLVVHVVESSSLATSAVELRQQSRAEGLGWYTQSTVRLSPEQVAGFRAMIGTVPGAAAARRRSLDAAISSFRVVRADSA